MFLVLLWFHLIDILYGTVFKLMVLSSAGGKRYFLAGSDPNLE
jgi:hypothetical protein